MMKNTFRLSALAFLISLPLPLFAQTAVDSTTPDASFTVAAVARGEGVQIYQCQEQSGTYAWVFQAPEAVLMVPGTTHQLGKHSAGPTWAWADGSTLQGKVLTKTASPKTDSIPWLLLETHSVGAAQGTLAGVTRVRRADTEGGNAPSSGCDAAHANAMSRVPYSAIYTFYRPR